jgi:uncharacterized OB-fold protein
MARWYDRLRRSGLLTDLRAQRRFRVAPSLAGPKLVLLYCHYCGYDPGKLPESGICPKCGGSSWERFTVSKRLLLGPT